MSKVILSFFTILLVSSCVFFTSRTITLKSQNELANAPLNKRYLYIKEINPSQTNSLISKKTYNLLAYYFSINGWKIVDKMQNAPYVLQWLNISNSASATHSKPKYKETNYKKYQRRKINYNQEIDSYYSVKQLIYFNRIGFTIIDTTNNQEVYTFILGANDNNYISDDDFLAYMNWSLKNKFDGTNGELINIYCDSNNNKTKCSTGLF